MRYDSESSKILINARELVAIARRGASQVALRDEDESRARGVTASTLKRLAGEGESQALTLDFTSGDFGFTLTGEVERVADGRITLCRTVSSLPISKNELAAIRGEGFILGYTLAMRDGLKSVELRFIYLSAESGETEEGGEVVSLRKLEEFFNKCRIAVALFAAPEVDRVTRRLPSMKALRFPYKYVREGQSEFVQRAYRVLSRGGTLYATAPTGTGKTVSAIYPALRAMGDGRVDKVFYLTPKTTTSEAAKECLLMMEKRGGIIRSIILTAKERICPMGHICKNAKRLCPRSRHNKLAEAAIFLFNLGKTVVEKEDILKVAEEFHVCPYELSLNYSELCDVVICDINYLFDPVVYIKRFFTEGGRFAFLIDEAHNLSDRAREMYSADLSLSELYEPEEELLLGPTSQTKKLAPKASAVFSDTLLPYLKGELRRDSAGNLVGATHLTEIPGRLYQLFDEILKIVEGEIKINQGAKDSEADARLAYLRNYYYKVKKYADAMARFDTSYRMFLFYEEGEIRTRLCCLDTAYPIRKRLAKGHSALMFSATLSPLDYYRSVLGGERSDETLEVDSPFDPSQLSVCIMDRISTRFSERQDTLPAVVNAVAATVSAKRGNYMIFCPSFAYSVALSTAFSKKYPKLRVIVQKPNMTQQEKEDFLAEFKRDDESYLIAFCVMGGIYAEGIDLAGDSLIGAVIVGIGMPSLSYEREAIADYYQEKYEEGKQYAYIYPGMNRVFQAAGRVIRRESDRGVIVLIDDRFDDPLYKKSLPKLWEGVKFIGTAKQLKEELDEFWRVDKNN